MRHRCGAGLVVRPDHALVCRDHVPDGLARPGLPVASAVNFDGRRGFDGALWERAMNDGPLNAVSHLACRAAELMKAATADEITVF